MSPIIELQRRMVEAGRIRAGDRAETGRPRKLEHWRLTSKDKDRLLVASQIWGGTVQPWNDEYELYTETDSLPILVEPGRLPTTWYELWSKGGCQRRCDGVHEMVSDQSCLCNSEDERQCKPTTRLSVMLPDLPGIGSWLLTSNGWNAATELVGAVDLLQRASAQGVLIPARLTLQQRVEVKAGQTRRFAVPVIDIDMSFRELLGGNQGALSAPSEVSVLPSGYTPVRPNGGGGVSLSEGLAQAETQTAPRTARSAAPIPSTDVELGGTRPPVPVDDGGASPPAAILSAADAPPPTFGENIAALNAIVGSLRDAGKITTRQVWVSMARARGVKVDEMIELLQGVREGELHWSPLRDSLDEDEAVELRKRMGKFWAENMKDPLPS